MKCSVSGATVIVAGFVVGAGLFRSAFAEETTSDVRIRQAEEKLDTTLKAAENRLLEAHEQFRRSVAEARKQFLADVGAARTALVSPPAPSPSSAKPAEKFEDLPVNVPGNTPTVLLDSSDSIWSEVPAVLQGAVIYEPPNDARKDGVVEFTIQRDARIGLAASWAYDGNSGGGWQSERSTKRQLVDAGWIEVGKMYRGLYDRHTIFLRQCKKGELFRIRTRKYREPYVLVPGFVENPQPSKPQAVAPKTVVNVLGAKIQHAGELLAPDQMRAELEGTLVHNSGVSGVAIVHVHQRGSIYVAASWDYDGNSSGQWTKERWLKEDFEKNGWEEIGTVKIPHRGHEQKHILFVRECNKGDQFRIRTRKYGAPFVFVPQTK